MLKLLEVTGIPADRAAASIATCPGCPFFLKHDYIKDHWGMAELPADKLQYTLSVADKIQALEAKFSGVNGKILQRVLPDTYVF